MAGEIPARIEDHMAYESPLALAAELIDETAIGYGSTGDFKKALDRALVKHGIAHTAADAKAALFAGADDGNAAKRARWKAEDQEEAAPLAMTEAVRGTRGKQMIAAIRTPQLRRVIRDEPGIKITVPV